MGSIVGKAKGTNEENKLKLKEGVIWPTENFILPTEKHQIKKSSFSL